MENWQMFAAAGLVLVAAELLTPTFFTLPAGIAFFATAIVAAFVDDIVVLYSVLGGSLLTVYTIMYLFVWPKMGKKSGPKTGADAMTGKTATVSEAVDPTTGAGEVKLYGDSWRVISEQAFEIGQRVQITRTEGNKVVVRPVQGDES